MLCDDELLCNSNFASLFFYLVASSVQRQSNT